MISHFYSAMVQASYFKLTYPQLKWLSHKMGVAQPLREKTPKLRVLNPGKTILSLKSLHFLATVLSVERKATEL